METARPEAGLDGGACPVTRLVDVIGGRWKVPILWQLSTGTHRYGALRRAIGGISERMLVQQLRALEADGLVARTQYPEVPPRVEYALTERGCSLVPLLQGLAEWSATHLTAGAER
ncbi:winged helix-turn-helix transcriptional regulator [Rubricoccus marinus]|uniref:HTH hxlR-type domain-containing protein n=1 Tax=Rubricoccus marinus TaxID=716817 RepID=A0A259TVW0_9BACT|nr:helix-turn-helix domain-containing protein [Rubricoccus marinus]OZC01767.1 hypothetical protein BSZ36_01445 [Rubricoccus marinus]